MVDRTKVESQIETWFHEINPGPLLVVGSGAYDTVTTFISSLQKDTEVQQLTTEEASIKIKHVRNFLAATEHTSLQAHRLLYIPQAEKLLPASANALLKALEESKGQNRFLLATSFPGRLLATIRSRCRIIRTHTPLADSPTDTTLPTFDPKRKNPLSEKEVDAIANILQKRATEGPHTPALKRSLMRLRDYYKITSLKGNSKMAADVLLASLAELHDN